MSDDSEYKFEAITAIRKKFFPHLVLSAELGWHRVNSTTLSRRTRREWEREEELRRVSESGKPLEDCQ